MENKNFNPKIEIVWTQRCYYNTRLNIKNNFKRIKILNIIIFWIWNYTSMCELSTQNVCALPKWK